MAAYVILDVAVTDPVAYEEYKAHSTRVLEQYDGKFLVRGGAAQVLEGEWTPHRVVLLAFPTVERAREWWASPEYAGPRDIRRRASRGNMILVEGV